MSSATYHFASYPAASHASLLDALERLPAVVETTRESALTGLSTLINSMRGWQGVAASPRAAALEIGAWVVLALVIAAA